MRCQTENTQAAGQDVRSHSYSIPRAPYSRQVQRYGAGLYYADGNKVRPKRRCYGEFLAGRSGLGKDCPRLLDFSVVDVKSFPFSP
jgi:hypothetical protein